MRRPLKLCELDRECILATEWCCGQETSQLLLPLTRKKAGRLTQVNKNKKNGGTLQWGHKSVFSDPSKSDMPIVSAFECEIKGKKTLHQTVLDLLSPGSPSLRPVLLSFRVRAYAEF